MFNAEQYAYLLRPINEKRVHKDGKGKRHVQAYDVRAELIRAFGFGNFSIETVGIHLISATENGNRWTVLYRADVRLTVRSADGRECRYEDSATGDAINQPGVADAHDLAIKKALSQALKRCAVNLGDQFGLALYNKDWAGMPLVRGSMAAPKSTGEQAPTIAEPDAALAPEDDEQAGEAPVNEEAIILAKEFTVAIGRAKTKDDLTAVAREIKRAVEGAQLGNSSRETLAEIWQERKEELIREGIWT